jgi:hypothetical protein
MKSNLVVIKAIPSKWLYWQHKDGLGYEMVGSEMAQVSGANSKSFVENIM